MTVTSSPATLRTRKRLGAWVHSNVPSHLAVWRKPFNIRRFFTSILASAALVHGPSSAVHDAFQPVRA